MNRTLIYGGVLWLLMAFASADNLDGERLYREAGGYGCAVCHGQVGDGAGQAGGYIRGATLEQLNESLLTNDPMKPLSQVLNDQDRQNLAGFLSELAKRPLISVRYENGEWIGQAEAWQPGDQVDVVLYNATFDLLTLDFPIFSEPVELVPLGTHVWQGQLNDLSVQLPGLTLERL